MVADRADGDAAEEPMVKIDCRVPASLLDAIDDAYEERGYSTRSEAIRDALRDWLDPSVTLSPETVEALAESRRERECGETHSLEEVARELDGDDGGGVHDDGQGDAGGAGRAGPGTGAGEAGGGGGVD